MGPKKGLWWRRLTSAAVNSEKRLMQCRVQVRKKSRPSTWTWLR